MASTVSERSLRNQSNGLRARLDEVRATSQPPAKVSERADLLGLIRSAAADCNLSQKALAINAGCSESELSDGLSGRRNFAAAWIWSQPDTFLLRFVELMTEARGLTPAAVREVRANRIAELIRLLLVEAA